MLKDSALWGEGFGENSVFSLRRLLGTAAVGLAAAGIGSLAGCGASQATPQRGTNPQPTSVAARPEGVLGANFNGDPSAMSFPELQDVKATWVRGFFAMPDADTGNPADQPVIWTLLTAAGLDALSADIGPDATPWLLIGMFCQHNVQPARDGLPGQNTVWTDKFRSLML